jgi:RNA polymerase primary sigma factor
VAGAATSPSSTRTRRVEPEPGPLTTPTSTSADAEAVDDAVVPDEEIIVADEDEVELIDVETIAVEVDPSAASDVIVVGVVEVDDDEDEDEESPTPAAVPVGTKDAAAPAADSDEFTWDDEEESEALKQARKDAELTASADSVRAYLKQIGKVALLNAEEEVDLAKRIEAGLYSSERMRQQEEAGERLTNQMRRDLRWIKRDGERAKNHLLEANLHWSSPSPSATPGAAWRSST